MIAFEPDGEVPLGVARFVRRDEPGTAEVAVTVVDDWQGRGVATALLERLTSAPAPRASNASSRSS